MAKDERVIFRVSWGTLVLHTRMAASGTQDCTSYLSSVIVCKEGCDLKVGMLNLAVCRTRSCLSDLLECVSEELCEQTPVMCRTTPENTF